MERTKAYRSLLKGGVTICVFVMVLFLCMLYSNNFWPLLVCIGLLGKLAPIYRLEFCWVLLKFLYILYGFIVDLALYMGFLLFSRITYGFHVYIAVYCTYNRVVHAPAAASDDGELRGVHLPGARGHLHGAHVRCQQHTGPGVHLRSAGTSSTICRWQ